MSQFSFGNALSWPPSSNQLQPMPPEPISSSENETSTKFKYCKKPNIEKKIKQKSVSTKTNI